MMADSQQLLIEYTRSGSEAAFRELVARYIDLVHSAAVRLVNRDTHLAEDVTQTVFADLARLARKLPSDVMLGGWLHRHTCFVASKTMRGERRRQARERQAVEMNAIEDHSAANLAQVAPVLDDAINQLGAEDRAAILLRFFEQGDFRSVGTALGSTEEAARKRVDRALEKLEFLLKRHGVALTATALASTLATQAVVAAPVGLAVSISTVALSGAAVGSGTTFTLLNLMSMTKLKIGIVSAVVIAAAGVPWMMHQRARTELDAANEALRQRDAQIAELMVEKQRFSAQLARLSPVPPAASNGPSSELLRLRGEVGRLRQETAAEKTAAVARANAPSALSGVTADPEMRKVIRDQQKTAMAMIYKDFAKRLKLAPELAEKLHDLHADDIMENIDRVTDALRGKSVEEINRVFAAQDKVLMGKVRELLGDDAFAQYRDYTRNLGSQLTADQFKGQLTGDKAAKDEKSRLLYQAMLEETQRTLANAGLPPDFQTIPSLNYVNMASESEAEKNLTLLDGIYERVQSQASAFLTPEEAVKFGEFRTKAVSNNRMALTMNRKMMTPGGK